LSLSFPGSAASKRGRLMFPIAAAVLAVVFVVATILAIAGYRDAHSADQQDSDRAAAVTAAEQFALRMDDFRAASAADYTAAIEKLLTTKGKADFAQVQSVIGQVFAATQPTQADKAKGVLAPNGKIVYAGVSDIDADSATVLVAHDTAVSGAAKSLNFRWTVALKKIGKTWLVDGLPPEVVGSQSQ